MSHKRTHWLFLSVAVLFSLALVWPAAVAILGRPQTRSAVAQQGCVDLTSQKDLPSSILINFDTLSNATIIGNAYTPSFGVTFEDGRTTRALVYGNEPAEARSSPNVAINSAVAPGTSAGVPMRIFFDTLKTHVAMYIGNGETIQPTALLTVYDANNGIICQVRHINVPEAHTDFIGLYDPEGRIRSASLDYGQTSLSESIDDLYFAPARGLPPTRTPLPAWTPVPAATATPGPTATPTPIIPAYAYQVVNSHVFTLLFTSDLAIHGIEITQGIQCFDTSKGLDGCPDNSLPVVAKKDATARIYLKLNSSIFSHLNNVPVRLYIRADGIWYTALASGKATTAINQANNDSADIYFNVNFNSDVPVDFYAVVDPNNTISESNETNNRYPSSGYINLNFRTRSTLKIVGTRLKYHPTGYGGTQNAGGWAVTGGAADWFEQVLPIRNNGVNYSIRSGYLDWTKSLSIDTNQHDLIKTLNAYWILENAFTWLFTGAFTNADHVYGWAPNGGYSGGHADMPVYPHAGGLGVTGIGTDRPGTNTDNPGGGALIFGHELVHDYDVLHTNTVDGCGSNDGASLFPYGSSSIQEFGFNPFTGMIYNPSNTHDLMSYCPGGGSKNGWISPYTWNRMYNNLAASLAEEMKAALPGAVKVFAATAAENSLVVNATIYNPDTAPAVPGKLGSLFKINTGVAYPLLPGEYAVELRNVDGAFLDSYPFTVNFESEYDGHGGEPHTPEDVPPFPPEPTTKVDVAFIVPWVDGTASIALMHGAQTLDVRVASANAPQVLMTSPTQQETWLAGSTHAITWQGLDQDGDSLSYSVFYSRNGGIDWVLLQSELSSQSYDVITNSLAGGSDVRFRVVVTDGVNTAADETAQSISVPNQPPQVTVLNPAAGSNHQPGALVVFQGSATDMEDGGLPDGALVWSSDVQGGLGVGPSLAVNTLIAGTHVITLRATDSFGISSEVATTVTIAYPVYLPGLTR